jgi:hypothetical protein
MLALLLAASLRCSQATWPGDPALREWMRTMVHDVARSEAVDPLALEALGVVETDLRPAVGASCELGPFQIMPMWAAVFELDSPWQLWDPRINAIAAARIYKSGLRRWNERYATAAHNAALRAAGFRGRSLDKETFAALAYNWGQAPVAFSRARDLRQVAIPASTAAYAVRFSRTLRGLRAGSGTPRGQSP